MRRSKLFRSVVLLIITLAIAACAGAPAQQTEAVSRIIGRRVGLHATRLDPARFTTLGTVAGNACKELSSAAAPPHAAFTLIAKAITAKTNDPFLVKDLQDIIQIIGIDIDAGYNVLNLTPTIEGAIVEFLCAFAQGVSKATANP